MILLMDSVQFLFSVRERGGWDLPPIYKLAEVFKLVMVITMQIVTAAMKLKDTCSLEEKL